MSWKNISRQTIYEPVEIIWVQTTKEKNAAIHSDLHLVEIGGVQTKYEIGLSRDVIYEPVEIGGVQT